MLAEHTRICCSALLLAVPFVWCAPLNHYVDRSSLAALSDLNSAAARLNRASLLQSDRDPRLPLPSAQDLETIKKVAQILIMLAKQEQPPTTEEQAPRPPASVCDSPAQEIPNDTVRDK